MTVRLVPELPPQQLLWRNDPAIYRWTRQNGPLTKAEHLLWLESLRCNHTCRFWGVMGKETKRSLSFGKSFKYELADEVFVGTAGLTSINYEHRTAEFSLLIGPEHQKKGFGKSALIELFSVGFGAMNLHVIYGETFTGNPAIKLFKDIGMVEEGLHRQRYEKDNERFDAISVSITRDEFYGISI